MADEEIVPAPAPARPGGGRTRLFLMVAGGLAAPSLALAAFFLSNSGGSATPARPPAVQAGQVTSASAAGRPSPGSVAPAATSTTAAPAAPAGPLRDPFAPLVSQAPPGGAPAR